MGVNFPTHSRPEQQLKVSGLTHPLAIVVPREDFLVPFGYEAGWIVEMIWKEEQWNKCCTYRNWMPVLESIDSSCIAMKRLHQFHNLLRFLVTPILANHRSICKDYKIMCLGNNDARTICIAANVVLSHEITEISFLEKYCSIKLAVGCEVLKTHCRKWIWMSGK